MDTVEGQCCYPSFTHLLGGGVGSAVVGSSLQAGADRDGHVSTDAEYRLTVGDDVPLQQLHPVIRVHDHAHAEPGPAVGLQPEQVVLLPNKNNKNILFIRKCDLWWWSLTVLVAGLQIPAES